MKRKSLICITTCNRLQFLKLFLVDYVRFTNNNHDFDFLLSLDGKDEEYLRFCDHFQIPCLYSDEREGVGISKNRVIHRFDNYAYYFFLDDDVELIDPDVFNIHIQVCEEKNIPHFSLGERHRFLDIIKRSRTEEYHLLHAMYGSGAFNFFSREGLTKVGGWHSDFAEFRRFGHTEHSFRFFTNGLCPAPFNVIEECIEGYFKWHNPEPVSKVKDVERTTSGIASVEKRILDQRLSFFPVKTISPYCFNDKIMSTNDYLLDYDKGRRRTYRRFGYFSNPYLTSNEKNQVISQKYFEFAVLEYYNKHYLKALINIFLAFVLARDMESLRKIYQRIFGKVSNVDKIRVV